jgi:hypothetical protein
MWMIALSLNFPVEIPPIQSMAEIGIIFGHLSEFPTITPKSPEKV